MRYCKDIGNLLLRVYWECLVMSSSNGSITKSSSAAGRTRHWLGNTSSCLYYAFRHITKSSASWSWWWLCYMSKRIIWTSACVAKPMSSVSCSWWWLCYMSKSIIWTSPLLPSRCLVRPAADDDFIIMIVLPCRKLWCPKVLKSTCMKFWCLSTRKKSTSSNFFFEIL